MHLLSIPSPEICSPRPSKRKKSSQHESDTTNESSHSSFEEPAEIRKTKISRVHAQPRQEQERADSTDQNDYEQFVDLEISACFEGLTVMSCTPQPMKKSPRFSGLTDKETSADSVSYKI